MPHKILIVEDVEDMMSAYRNAIELDGDVIIIGAATMVEALKAVDEHPDLEAIIVDGCFPFDAGGASDPEPGCSCNGVKFVLWLRGPCMRYAGPVIAGSASPDLNTCMLACGATITAQKGLGICRAVAELFPSTPAD